MYDVIVIGKGLFGSSAVRYLAERGIKTGIIGPDEPLDPVNHEGIFGAHYDEGRLTYQLKSDPVWSDLAVKSLARFPRMEEASGVRFHTPAGNLYLTDEKMGNGRLGAETMAAGKAGGIQYEELDVREITRRYPFLMVRNGTAGLFEAPPAGYFSPRRFIQAQIKLAPGVDAINDIVVGVDTGRNKVSLKTSKNGRFPAKKILIAAGAYSNNFNLLGRPLSLKLKQEYVLYAELPWEELERLHGMPPVVYRIDHPRLADLYILPPIQYPDGRHYLKMGANTDMDEFVETADEINRWYRDGNSDLMLEEMWHLLNALFPGLAPRRWKTGRCVITRTAHQRPYIDEVVPGRVYAAVGGNGQGAKAADEVGRLAADMVADDHSPGTEFAAVFQ